MGPPSEGRHPGSASLPGGPAARGGGIRRVMEAPWPPAFVARMRALLGEESGAFLEALARPRARGLRINPAKVGGQELASLLGLELRPVPWCPTGFLIGDGRPLGGHPAHLAGLFYLQDPSAMSAVEVLDPEPGWKVVDLAAAPGGKTTHL